MTRASLQRTPSCRSRGAVTPRYLPCSIAHSSAAEPQADLQSTRCQRSARGIFCLGKWLPQGTPQPRSQVPLARAASRGPDSLRACPMYEQSADAAKPRCRSSNQGTVLTHRISISLARLITRLCGIRPRLGQRSARAQGGGEGSGGACRAQAQ